MRPRLRRVALLLLAAAGPARAAADNARVYDAAVARVAREYRDPAAVGPAWRAEAARLRPAAVAAGDTEALYRTLNTLLDHLGDSHSFAIPPDEVRAEHDADHGRAAPSFGLSCFRENGRWLVTAVAPGGAAAVAGVRPGWTLETVDGRVPDADQPPLPGERATLVLRDPAGAAHVVSLVAELTPPSPSVRETRLAGGVLLLAVDGFEHREDRAVARALAGRPASSAVVLDLRDNDGGEERAAARVAGLFLATPHTLLVRIGRDGAHPVPVAAAGARGYRGPLAVLVGERSASAAEALAAALDESGRAETVGTRTAGALTGAVVEPLPDGGRISIAVADVRTPGGRRIEGAGFTPRHLAPATPADLAAGRDPALAEALRLLRAGR